MTTKTSTKGYYHQISDNNLLNILTDQNSYKDYWKILNDLHCCRNSSKVSMTTKTSNDPEQFDRKSWKLIDNLKKSSKTPWNIFNDQNSYKDAWNVLNDRLTSCINFWKRMMTNKTSSRTLESAPVTTRTPSKPPGTPSITKHFQVLLNDHQNLSKDPWNLFTDQN